MDKMNRSMKNIMDSLAKIYVIILHQIQEYKAVMLLIDEENHWNFGNMLPFQAGASGSNYQK